MDKKYCKDCGLSLYLPLCKTPIVCSKVKRKEVINEYTGSIKSYEETYTKDELNSTGDCIYYIERKEK